MSAVFSPVVLKTVNDKNAPFFTPLSYYFLMPDFWQDHIKLVKVHFCWLNYRPIF